LGTVHLAQALHHLGCEVKVITDHPCKNAIDAGLQHRGHGRECQWEDLAPGFTDEEMRRRYWPKVWVDTLPGRTHPWDVYLKLDWRENHLLGGKRTHVLAIERSGPADDE